MKTCSGYCGIACVNGTCPKALAEEYEERGMDMVKDCSECSFYRGCEDCAFLDTVFCVGVEKK